MKQRTPAQAQRGATLFVVMVMVMLTTLLVLWASRSAYFSELVTGNDSDYQRALEAAHAMLRDAELDIQGMQPDGSPCSSDASANCRIWNSFDAANAQAFYPEDESEMQDLVARLNQQSPPCVAGICAPITSADADSAAPATEFWTQPDQLEAMQGRAAHYGQFTGAQAGDVGNPLLVSSSQTRAWYWVELLPYDSSTEFGGGAARVFAPDAATPHIYRITAVAQGLKPNTQAVVQTVFVWKKVES